MQLAKGFPAPAPVLLVTYQYRPLEKLIAIHQALSGEAS
jgi:hypothetical protein